MFELIRKCIELVVTAGENPPLLQRELRGVPTLKCAVLLAIITAAPPGLLAQEKKGERGPTLVATSPIIKKNLSSEQSFVGSLLPVKRSVIGSAVDGRVEKVFVDEGDAVGADANQQTDRFQGTPLIQIKRDTLDIEIEAANIELELRQKALEELRKNIPREIELSKANVAQAAAQKEYAEQLYNRSSELDTGQGISKKELEESVSQFRIQSQAWIAAQADLAKLESTRVIRLTIAEKRVAAQEAELRRLADLRSKYTVRAPFDGFVTKKHVETGDWVTEGAPVAEVITLDPIEMRVNVPQQYLKQLQYSFDNASESNPMIAAISIDSLEQKLQGTVVQIIPEADQRTRSIPIVIRIANPKSARGHLLKPGLLARASLQVGEASEVLMISKDALVLGQTEIVLFVLEDPTQKQSPVRRVVVRTGVAEGNRIAIEGQVQEGDRVVVKGNERLRPGQIVQNQSGQD